MKITKNVSKNNKIKVLLGICMLFVAAEIGAMQSAARRAALLKGGTVQQRQQWIQGVREAQARREAQIRHIADKLKKDEVFIYQEGTVKGITVPKHVAESSQVIKNMLENFSNPEYEITIPLQLPLEMIEIVFSLLDSGKPDKQSLVNGFSLKQLVPVVNALHVLDCKFPNNVNEANKRLVDIIKEIVDVYSSEIDYCYQVMQKWHEGVLFYHYGEGMKEKMQYRYARHWSNESLLNVFNITDVNDINWDFINNIDLSPINDLNKDIRNDLASKSRILICCCEASKQSAWYYREKKDENLAKIWRNWISKHAPNGFSTDEWRKSIFNFCNIESISGDALLDSIALLRELVSYFVKKQQEGTKKWFWQRGW